MNPAHLLKNLRKLINPPYNAKNILAIIGAVLLLVAIPLTVYITQQGTNLRPKAAVGGALSVSGNQILDSQGNVVVLRGVTRWSMEFNCSDGHFTVEDFQAIRSWGANAVRITLNDNFWINGNPEEGFCTAQQYQTNVKNAITNAEAAGLRPILSLQWTGNRLNNGRGGQEKLPIAYYESNPSVKFAPKLWDDLSTIYADDPLVMYSLFAEPHDMPGQGTAWYNDFYRGFTNSDGVHVGMQDLYDIIDGNSPNIKHIIFISGSSWAKNLDFADPAKGGGLFPGTNLVLEVHPYGYFNNYIADWTALKDIYPIVNGELGVDSSGDTIDIQLQTFEDWQTGYFGWAWTDTDNHSLLNSGGYTSQIPGTNPPQYGIPRSDSPQFGTRFHDFMLANSDDISPPSTTLIVGSGGYSTISAAVAAASAGDTIKIKAGTYNEQVVVNKSVTIEEFGDGDVWVNGSCTMTHNLEITASNVIIKGIKFRQANEAALKVSSADNATIDGVTIQDFNCANLQDQFSAGVASWGGGKNLTVKNSTITRRVELPGSPDGFGNGIWVKNNSSNAGGGHLFSGNTIIGGYDGIGGEPEDSNYGSFNRDTIIENNTVVDCGDDGIQSEGGNQNVVIRNNTIKRCLIGIAFTPALTGPLTVLRNVISEPIARYGLGAAMFKMGDSSTAEVRVYHNSFFAGGVTADGAKQTNAFGGNIHFRNNAIYASRYVFETTSNSPASSANYDAMYTTDSNRFVKWNNSTYSSLSSFRTNTGQGQNSINSSNFGWNTSTLQLQTGSLLIDAGVVIPGINDNYKGSGPDIGAYEFDGVSVPPDDTTPPTITISIPNNGDEVSGSQVQISATATDESGIDLMTILIDGQPKASTGNGSISYTWDTTQITNKLYTILVNAVDTFGNPEEKSIQVTVNNTVSQPKPIVDISADGSNGPIKIIYNQSTKLVWDSNNTETCIASGAWSGSLATSGTKTINNINSKSTFTIKCDGSGGTAADSVVVDVFKQADLNKDSKVDIFDLSILLANWGKSGIVADLNNSGKVDIFDLSMLLAKWGS